VKFLVLSSRDEANWFSTGIVIDASDSDDAINRLAPEESRIFSHLMVVSIEEIDLLRLNESLGLV